MENESVASQGTTTNVRGAVIIVTLAGVWKSISGALFALARKPVSTQAAAYVLTAADEQTVVQMNYATAVNLTVPPDVFPVGAVVHVAQVGAGQVTLVAGSGVTIRSYGTKLKLQGQYAQGVLYHVGANVWNLRGDLSA